MVELSSNPVGSTIGIMVLVKVWGIRDGLDGIDWGRSGWKPWYMVRILLDDKVKPLLGGRGDPWPY